MRAARPREGRFPHAPSTNPPRSSRELIRPPAAPARRSRRPFPSSPSAHGPVASRLGPALEIHAETAAGGRSGSRRRVDRAFGAGPLRQGRRAGARASRPVRPWARSVAWAPDACRLGGRLLGCARMARCAWAGRPAAFLGPFCGRARARSAARGLPASDADRAGRRRGRRGPQGRVMTHVLLVGDAPYFRAGWASRAPGSRGGSPGPVDQRRVLVPELVNAGAGPLERPGDP